MSDLCLQNEAYTVCSALVLLRGLCRIFAYRTRHTKCAARLIVRVAYVGSLLIGEDTVCSALLPSRALCQIFPQVPPRDIDSIYKLIKRDSSSMRVMSMKRQCLS